MISPGPGVRVRGLLPLLTCLMGFACVSEGELAPVESPVDLGGAPPGTVLEGRLSVFNGADGPATITGISWVEDREGAFFFPDDRKALPVTVAPGERFVSTLRFQSATVGVYWGTVALVYVTRGGALERRVEVGVSAAALGLGVDLDGDGYSVADGDCDDEDPALYPGAEEICDGLDNDCDGFLPHGEEDEDGDGYAPCEGDCADGSPEVYPGAPEGCDGIDTDCDGVMSDYDDEDGDGLSPCHGDCDDGDPAVHPNATEVCNGVDDDCDGEADDVDADGDGYVAEDCGGGDCDDGDPAVHPGATEVCNGVDDDCDGNLAGGEADGDGDGVMICEGDCDDGDPSVHPGAAEQCNGVDDDCDGTPDPPGAGGCQDYHADMDADGYGDAGTTQCLCAADPPYTTQDDADCFDNNDEAYPGAPDWQTQQRGDGSFDFDCDGSEEEEHPDLGSCYVDDLGLCHLQQAGWIGGVPPCGVHGNWLSGCIGVEAFCHQTVSLVIQACR